MMDYLFYFSLFLTGIISSNAENVLINISLGSILGRIMYTNGLNNTMYAFQGIPYAEPPIRFEMAKEKEAWTDVLNCTYDKPQCVQGITSVVGSEDCLTLNVYSPNVTGSYPVYVYIHGGAFVGGSASYENEAPDFLIDENTVFVAIQYRLGIFGFLSTEDLVCPGNLGLKDQMMALKWINKHIQSFGGDPTKITLGGQSVGAVSASLHAQSPMSQGLFKALILESGTSFNLWGFNRRASRTAFSIGSLLCFFAVTSESLISCLKKQDYKNLHTVSLLVSALITLENPLAGIMFGYVEEPDHPNAFFTGDSYKRLSTGNFTQVPILLGFNSNEAAFFGDGTSYFSLIQIYFLTYNIDQLRIAPIDLTDNLLYRILADSQIKQYFFGLLGIVAVNDDKLARFISSDQFERPNWQFALLASKYVNETYFYQFSYEGSLSGVTERTFEGVGHTEEVFYIFDFPQYAINASATDLLVRKRTVRIWCNFIKTWNPTPDFDPLLQNITWLPVRSGNVEEEYNYLNINSTLDVLKNPKNPDMQFWNNLTYGIYPKYGDKDYNTY